MSPSVANVPSALGKVKVLSTSGSAAVSVNSAASAVEPSKTRLEPSKCILFEVELFAFNYQT